MAQAPIRVHEDSSTKWIVIRDVSPNPDRHPDRYLDSSYRVHEQGTDESLQLLEGKYLPDTFVDVHAHLHDEIIYVVEGEMVVGNKALKPGSSVFVAANTLYSFKAGPNGLRFLNFRPLDDRSHISKEDFLARKRVSKAK